MRKPSIFALFLAVACTSTPAEMPDAALDVDAGDDAGPTDTGPRPPDAYTRDADWSDAGMPLADYGTAGPHPVGNVRVTMTDRTGARMLPVEIWYPADESARADATTGQPMTAFEQGTANETALADYVASAPATCIRAQTRSAAAPPAATSATPWPALVFSHCHGCVRFDVAEIAERLASHGIVVAAPDHLEDTLWDPTLAGLNADYLAVRVSDVSSVLDRLLDATASEIPADLRGHVDATRVGVMGHSYGAITVGAAVLADTRFVAGMSIAAPPSALGVSVSDIHVPYLFLLASEDNSIGAVGNTLIRSDYADLAGPAWLVEVADAGHFSFSDIAGLHDSWNAGCGTGITQELPRTSFSYIDNAEARELGADVAAYFWASQLLGDPAAVNGLSELTTPAFVSMHE